PREDECPDDGYDEEVAADREREGDASRGPPKRHARPAREQEVDTDEDERDRCAVDVVPDEGSRKPRRGDQRRSHDRGRGSARVAASDCINRSEGGDGEQVMPCVVAAFEAEDGTQGALREDVGDPGRVVRVAVTLEQLPVAVDVARVEVRVEEA